MGAKDVADGLLPRSEEARTEDVIQHLRMKLGEAEYVCERCGLLSRAI